MNKRAMRPNLGGVLRPRTDSPRHSFLYIEVTEEERKAIHDYCFAKNISVSQFLADLLLQEAAKPKPKQNVLVKPVIELTPDEYDKLELLAKLHNEGSVDEFIRDLIRPNLEIQKLHSDLDTRPLRFYLSEEEHSTISDFMAEKGVPARKYATMLAIKAVGKTRKKRK